MGNEAHGSRRANKEIKTLRNLEDLDTVKTKAGAPYIVVKVFPTFVIIARENNGVSCYRYTLDYMEKQGWTVERPMTKIEKGAKTLLELAGFKVSR